jgi:hypothetical protein
MGRTTCTEPQCQYSRAIPLLLLWAVRPVQSLSACTRVTFTNFYYVTEYKVGCDALGVMNMEAVVANFDTLKLN